MYTLNVLKKAISSTAQNYTAGHKDSLLTPCEYRCGMSERCR